MTLDEKIAFFFAPPEPEQEGNSRSTLHLLRREAQDCLIGKLVSEDAVIEEAHAEPRRWFATTMVLMTGIDLLAKCYAGSDKDGTSRRFRTFTERYIVNPRGDVVARAAALYQGLRNPLLHSFTVHSEDYIMRLVLFQAANEPVWLRAGNPHDVVISIAGVYLAFVRAVRRYESDVRIAPDLQAKFERMFAKYGRLQYFLR
jgi:hypothetical protein